ncbi:putative ABC transport system permease protein [Chryseolinea serpens]|uniref:Putative ABC transport system permease protein n=1 Tax=Chryseolinea serpens TaxID=947013 RepID=A0A1M5K5T9_9BACT|nr:ABC transporter permease [Chryseolinea serpens]SHG47603.1 putative ABC transport system permease protein [Chryseolinea serpens]
MNKPVAHPPLLFLKFFRWYCDPKMLDYIEGDLMEAYHARLKKYGKRKADAKFIVDVLLLFRPGIIRSKAKYNTLKRSHMINSYFKTGWRNLLRSKLHSGLNIVGLTFGIVCFLLIGLYVFDELTFDQQHVNAERIYRVIEHKNVRGEATTIAAAGYKLAEESKHSIPEVENITRIMRTGRANLVDPENPVPFQETVTIADDHFLEIFDFPLVEGDRRTALKEPASIIIDEDLALRIFNRTDVMGKNLQFSHLPFPLKITGILKNHPRNSSFNFNCVMSESSYYAADYFKETMASDWASNSFSVYALLRPDSRPDSVSKKMTRLVLTNFKPDEGTKLSYSLQPLKELHLKSAGIFDGARNTNVEGIPQGNPLYVTIFSFTALFVLLIAAINYTNLTTARASGRVKEIGVRKAIGAMRSNLIGQFLFESWLTTGIAFILAIGVVKLVLPPFNHFANKELSLFSVDYHFWIYAMTAIVVIGFLSGSYSALLLSRLKPVSLLKGLKLQTTGDLSVRTGLVIFQFTISIVMIIGTLVLLLQVRYLNHTDLGFNKDLMVVIDVNTRKARSNFETIKDQMSKIASVKSVSVTSRVPGEWKTLRTVKVSVEGSTDAPGTSYLFGADKEFMQTFEVTLLQGRNFREAYDSSSIIINETAARMLNITGVSEQMVEIPAASRDGYFETLEVPFKPRVIGIVKDFHFQSLRDKIQPLILAYNNNPIHVIDYYSVRIAPVDIPGTLNKLKAIMVANDADDPFEYHFLDDQLALFYVEDARRQTLLGWAALATIFIACLGLFGLATYSTEQRVKEIGIRKVLGATVVGLVSLLSRDFLKLVLIANGIAFPIAWWATNRWLQEYAYHIDVEWWVFAAAGTLALGIALMTISYQAIKTAVANPVNSLRSE